MAGSSIGHCDFCYIHRVVLCLAVETRNGKLFHKIGTGTFTLCNVNHYGVGKLALGGCCHIKPMHAIFQVALAVIGVEVGVGIVVNQIADGLVVALACGATRVAELALQLAGIGYEFIANNVFGVSLDSWLDRVDQGAHLFYAVGQSPVYLLALEGAGCVEVVLATSERGYVDALVHNVVTAIAATFFVDEG